MKLVREKDNLSNFVIYELNNEEQEIVKNRFGEGKKFYVSSLKFGNLFLEKHSFKDISQDKNYYSLFYYNGFFETYLEAYYHIKLIESLDKLDHVEWEKKKFCGVEIFDKENHCMITEYRDEINAHLYPLTEDKPNPKDHPEFD